MDITGMGITVGLLWQTRTECWSGMKSKAAIVGSVLLV